MARGQSFLGLRSCLRPLYASAHRSETTSALDHEALFAACGVRLHRPWIQWVGRDLDVVAHCNWPWPLALVLPFEPDYLAGLKHTVDGLRSRQMQVVLDVHNCAKYRGQKIGSEQVPVAAFAELWGRLATTFKDDPVIWGYGLRNEPACKPWAPAAQAAVRTWRWIGGRATRDPPGKVHVLGSARRGSFACADYFRQQSRLGKKRSWSPNVPARPGRQKRATGQARQRIESRWCAKACSWICVLSSKRCSMGELS